MIEASRGDEPKYDMVLLDELNIVLRYGYLDLQRWSSSCRTSPRCCTSS